MKQPDMTWAIPIAATFAVAFLLLIIQAVIVIWCIHKREKGKRASNFLEIIAGYDSKQRRRTKSNYR